MEKNDNLLKEYQKFVGKSEEKARAAIMKLKYKKDAYLLSCIALTYRDEALFFKNGTLRKKIKEDKMSLAKRYIDKAFDVSPQCRDVLYLKGTIYHKLGERANAFDCFITVVELRDQTAEKYNCSGEDEAYIKMLTNDARFELYRMFFDGENYELANELLAEYKQNLKMGVKTIFKPLKKYLKKKPRKTKQD